MPVISYAHTHEYGPRLPNGDSVGMDINRRKPEHMTITVLDMEISGKRPRGRPRIRCMDNIRRDMRLHGLDTSMTEDRKVWSTMVAKVDTR